MLLGLCGFVGCAGLLPAQVLEPVTAQVDLASLFTAGGISYAGYTWTMGGCLELASFGPVLRNDSHCAFDFGFALETGVACPNEVWLEHATVVLGALAPGAHTLTTTSWGVPVTTNTFAVPTNSTPTLQPLGFAADGSFQIQVNGAAQVGYVLQGSTNLANWTALATNSVPLPSLAGPWPATVFVTDTSPVWPAWRFYRVQAVTLGPIPGL